LDTKTADALVEIMKKQQAVIHEQQEKMAEKFQENFKKLHGLMQAGGQPSVPVYEKVPPLNPFSLQTDFYVIVDRLDKIEKDLKALKAMSHVSMAEG